VNKDEMTLEDVKRRVELETRRTTDTSYIVRIMYPLVISGDLSPKAFFEVYGGIQDIERGSLYTGH
jgi:hypothetical protein